MKQPIRYDRKQESGIRHILKKIFAIREIVILLLVLALLCLALRRKLAEPAPQDFFL